MAKILTARQAVDTYFYDGATVTFGGFANGLMHPEEIMVALEEAARSSGHPRGLRLSLIHISHRAAAPAGH